MCVCVCLSYWCVSFLLVLVLIGRRSGPHTGVFNRDFACVVGLSKGNSYKKYVCQKYVGEVKGIFFVHFAAASLNGIVNGAMLCPCANSRGSRGSIMVDTFFPFYFILFFYLFMIGSRISLTPQCDASSFCACLQFYVVATH